MMRWILVLATLTACATGGESAPPVAEEWTYATAMSDCAPWDGAATTVYLTNDPYAEPLPQPFLRLAVYHAVSEMQGKRWQVGSDHDQDGLPSLCAADGTCVLARTGWIEFDPMGAGGPLVGRYDLTLADGRRITGRFNAVVLERLALCG